MISYDPGRAAQQTGGARAGSSGGAASTGGHPPARGTARTLLTVAYLLAAGAFFLVAPWTSGWEANLFLRESPRALRRTLEGNAVRGVVAGFGLAHLAVAAADLFALRREGRRGG